MGNNDSKQLQQKYEELKIDETKLTELEDKCYNTTSKDDKVCRCETEINELKSGLEIDIRVLKENQKTDLDDRVKEIRQLKDGIMSLKLNHQTGKKNLEDLSEDYYRLKRKINTFVEQEKAKHTHIIDEISKHEDQIKNLRSDSEAGKKEIKKNYEELKKDIENLKTMVQNNNTLQTGGIFKCEKEMNKLKSDYKNQISTLKGNGETRNAGRVRKIKKLEEKITSLERDYHAGEKNLEDLSKDYYELKASINTFVEEEKSRHTAITDEIAQHEDQIKNLESDSEAGKKEIKTLFEMIETQNKQIVEIKTVQRESRSRENAAGEFNDLWKRKMEGLLTYQIERGRALENQCTNVAEEQQREIEICRNRIRACEIQTEGLVKTATETTDGLRYISGIILNLIHTQETAPQNNRALRMNQNEDDDASWRGTNRLANARSNANMNC